MGSLEEVAGELADLEQEAEVTTLRRNTCARTLEDFHDALWTLIIAHRRHDEQELGRIRGRCFIAIGHFARARMRGDKLAIRAEQNLAEESAVLLLADLVLDQGAPAGDSAAASICSSDRRRRPSREAWSTSRGPRSTATSTRRSAPMSRRSDRASPSISASGPVPSESKATTPRIR